MRITVITPTYNQAPFLRETIDSIQNQGYPDLEHIIINDGSTDNTREILDSYERENTPYCKRYNLTILHQKNQGEVATVNRGYELATGEIVGLVNSDDSLKPYSLLKIAEFMEGHSDVHVCYPDWQMIDQDSNIIVPVMKTREWDYLYSVKYHFCIPGPGTFVRKLPNWKEYLWRDPKLRYIADLEMWWRLGLKYQFARVPFLLASYRIHGGQLFTSPDVAKVRAEQHVDLWRQYYLQPNLPQEIIDVRRQALSSSYYVAAVSAKPYWDLVARYMLLALYHRPSFLWEVAAPALLGRVYQYAVGRRGLRPAVVEMTK